MASTLLEPELGDKDALFQKLLLNAAVCMSASFMHFSIF